MITGAEIVRAARRYLGVPFVEFGRARVGLDCVGLLIRVARDLSLPVEDVPIYPVQTSGGVLRRELGCRCQPASADASGAILAFRLGKLEHCAIRTDPGRIIHAWKAMHEVVEVSTEQAWERRIAGAFGFPGVTYG